MARPKAMKRFVNETQFPRRKANASAAVKVATVSYSKAYCRRSRSAFWRRFRRSHSSPPPAIRSAAARISGVTIIGIGTSPGSTPRDATTSRQRSGESRR